MTPKLTTRDIDFILIALNFVITPNKGHGGLLQSDIEPIKKKLIGIKIKKEPKIHYYEKDFGEEDTFIAGIPGKISSCGIYLSEEYENAKWSKVGPFTRYKPSVTCKQCRKKLGMSILKEDDIPLIKQRYRKVSIEL